jgi:hypothetical protein
MTYLIKIISSEWLRANAAALTIGGMNAACADQAGRPFRRSLAY